MAEAPKPVPQRTSGQRFGGIPRVRADSMLEQMAHDRMREAIETAGGLRIQTVPQRLLNVGAPATVGYVQDSVQLAVEAVFQQLAGGARRLATEDVTGLTAELLRIDAAEMDILQNIVLSNQLHTRVIEVEADNATISTTLSTLQTTVSSQATSITTLTSDLADQQAALVTEQITRADQVSSLSSQVQTLQAVTGSLVFVQTEPPVNGVDFDGALTNPTWYDSNDNNHPYRWNGTAFVSIRDQLITSAIAQITAETTARISGDGALATQINNLFTTGQAGNLAIVAAVNSEATARTTADSALAAQIDSLFAAGGDGTNYVAAAVLTETTARISGDSANASAITTLSSTVSGHTTSISTQATTINGLSAQYTVKVDNNGYVSGFGLASTLVNGTPYSEFVILANKFKIVTPGVTPQVPFVVGNINGVGLVGINGALVVDGTIAARSLSVTELSAIVANLGTVTAGTLKTSATTGMRLEISNAGSFPLWVGTGAKNTANAVFYVDTAGNAKFAGNVDAPKIQGDLSKFVSIVGPTVTWGPWTQTSTTAWRTAAQATILIGEYTLPANEAAGGHAVQAQVNLCMVRPTNGANAVNMVLRLYDSTGAQLKVAQARNTSEDGMREVSVSAAVATDTFVTGTVTLKVYINVYGTALSVNSLTGFMMGHRGSVTVPAPAGFESGTGTGGFGDNTGGGTGGGQIP